MSLPVFVWVLDHSEATLGARLVLLVLAEHAHDDGTESYPALDTIARRSRLTRKGTRDALKRLEVGGHIVAEGAGPRGQTKWRVVMRREGTTPHHLSAENGKFAAFEGEVATPEPKERTVQNRPPTSARTNELPDDFHPSMLGPLDEVMAHLTRVAAARNGSAPARASVARAMQKRPRKPWVQVAEDLEHWLVYGKGKTAKCADVVARWRQWVDREPELAVGNVAPIRRGKHAAPLEQASKTGRDKWRTWADQNVPDLPVAYAGAAADSIAYAGQQVTPDAVRARVAAMTFDLGEVPS